MSKIKFTIITLFPEALEPYLNCSMMWKAKEKGIVEFNFVNLRDYGLGPHKSVDDTPYGGGDGMLLRCEPIYAAIEEIKASDPSAKVILPTPAGRLWTQEYARKMASENSDLAGSVGGSAETVGAAPATAGGRDRYPTNGDFYLPKHYAILCPHYEGYDERIMPLIDYPISLGNFVLTGGELPALVIIDSIVRLIPGVLGGENSAAIESFSDGDNLEYPQYTKPADFRGQKVPDVLLSGHHGKIAEWRAAQSKLRTKNR